MGTEKILIVEDDAFLAEDLRDIVTSFGYETCGIADSFETARVLAPFSTIAFVDVNLRDGATGPRIGNYLANEFGVAVVMVTGNPEAIQTGIKEIIGVISKPIHPPIIGNVLEYLKDIRAGGRGVLPIGMRLFA